MASTDLVAGDQAVISNPNGTGANLRSDFSVLDETTLIRELAQGTSVTIADGPYTSDSGNWYWVDANDGSGGGFVEASLLTSATTEEPAAEDPTSTEATTEPETEAETDAAAPSGLPWQEPIDTGFVVDDNNELPVEGLACRVDASADAEIISRIPVNTTLEVVAARIWQGDASFVQVNCGSLSGFVNGGFVVLNSEQAPVETEVVTEVPTEEVVVTEVPVETEVVTEEVVPTEVVTEAPVETEVVTEEVVPTEVVTELPVETEIPTEVVTEIPVETEIPAEEVAVTEVVTEVVTEEATEVVTEVPAQDVVATEVVTEVPVETDVATEEVVVTDVATEVVTDVPVETELPTETVVETQVPAEAVVETEAPSETEVVTEEPTDVATEVTEEATAEAPVETEVATEVPTEAATEVTGTAEATEAATEEATEAVVEETPAPAGPAADISQMIGTATVTGSNGDGIRCRVGPGTDSATIMVMPEGTKVYVLGEAVDGWLKIACGGQEGFADVNYMWSGGASDAELPKSSGASIVVSGTGNGLNCRTGAGTWYPVITVVFDGTVLKTRGAASGGWVPVTCGGASGFVASHYVENTGGSAGSGSAVSGSTGSGTVTGTNGDGLRCRSGAGTSYSTVTVLGEGSKVSTRGAAQGAWIPVTCGGTAGWVHGDYFTVGGSTPTTPPTNGGGSGVTGTATVSGTNGDGVRCRTGVGTTTSTITVLGEGTKVSTRGGASSGWIPVVCGGVNGWVHGDYLTLGGGSSAPAPSNPAPSGMSNGSHAQTTANLNLRYQASLGSGVAAVAPAGTVVLITGGASNGFYSVDWDGLRGFMSGDYLSKTSAALSQRGGSAAPAQPAPGGSGTATGNAMVDFAMGYLGYPYVWATHGPASFDCSGFTYWVTKNVLGRDIGTGTWTQVSAGQSVSRSNLQPGDLVFFQNTYTAGLSHVGLYIGGGQFIHAQNEATGVVISDLSSTYYASRWYGAVRLA